MSVKTRTGSVLGTPSYMSPEQCRGHGKVDWRSDIYALGCIMYEMLVGHPPFQGSGYGEVLAQHIYEQPQPIRQIDPSMPEGLEALLLRMLVKNPDQRLQSMEEFAATLDSIPQLAGPPGWASRSRRRARIRCRCRRLSRWHRSGQQPPQPQKEPERTTLRGTASEKVPRTPGKRGLGIPLAVGGIIVLGVAGIVVATRGGASASSDPKVAAADPPPSMAPSPTPSLGGLMPKPDEPKPVETKPPEPAPEPPKPVEEAKAPPAPEPPKPVEEAKAPPAPEPPKPVEQVKARRARSRRPRRSRRRR